MEFIKDYIGEILIALIATVGGIVVAVIKLPRKEKATALDEYLKGQKEVSSQKDDLMDKAYAMIDRLEDRINKINEEKEELRSLLDQVREERDKERDLRIAWENKYNDLKKMYNKGDL